MCCSVCSRRAQRLRGCATYTGLYTCHENAFANICLSNVTQNGSAEGEGRVPERLVDLYRAMVHPDSARNIDVETSMGAGKACKELLFCCCPCCELARSCCLLLFFL